MHYSYIAIQVAIFCDMVGVSSFNLEKICCCKVWIAYILLNMVNTMLKKSDEYYNNYIFIVSVSKVVENDIYENTIRYVPI